jgi:hypothetical protein
MQAPDSAGQMREQRASSGQTTTSVVAARNGRGKIINRRHYNAAPPPNLASHTHTHTQVLCIVPKQALYLVCHACEKKAGGKTHMARHATQQRVVQGFGVTGMPNRVRSDQINVPTTSDAGRRCVSSSRVI